MRASHTLFERDLMLSALLCRKTQPTLCLRGLPVELCWVPCMDRSKIVAIVTGAISLILAIAYLMLVQFLDSRGPMVPAPDLGFLGFLGLLWG